MIYQAGLIGLEGFLHQGQHPAHQFGRTGGIGLLDAGGLGRQVAEDHIEKLPAAFLHQGLGRKLEHVTGQGAHLVREIGLHPIQVNAQHQSFRANPPGGVLQPRSRCAAQIEHPLAGTKNAPFAVDFLQLVNRTGGEALALCFVEEVVPDFFHGRKRPARKRARGLKRVAVAA